VTNDPKRDPIEEIVERGTTNSFSAIAAINELARLAEKLTLSGKLPLSLHFILNTFVKATKKEVGLGEGTQTAGQRHDDLTNYSDKGNLD
jgi:hypothetical protein